MFTNFTWWHFFGTFFLLLILYYPIILSLYFRKEVKLFWRRITATSWDYNASYGSVGDISNNKTDIHNDTPPVTDAAITGMIADLTEDIKNGIKAATDSQATKEQLFALLKNILAKYPHLKKAGQKVQINEFIIQECARSNYTIHMAQAYALWANATEHHS